MERNEYFCVPNPELHMVEWFRKVRALGAKLPALHPSSAAYLLCDQEQVNYVPQ